MRVSLSFQAVARTQARSGPLGLRVKSGLASWLLEASVHGTTPQCWYPISSRSDVSVVVS